MTTIHRAATILFILVLASLTQGQQSSSGNAIVIQNATIMTVTKGTIQNGSILIRDGKIAAVGQRVRAPADAQIIEAKGKYIIPGIIDCHSHIAIDGGVNEGTLAVTAMVRIEDALDPTDINIYRDLAGGVTTANVLHGSANPIGGQNSVIKLRWGKTAKEMLLEGAPPGIKFALGENPKRSNFNPPPGTQQRFPATRMGVEYVIREAFTEAREYMRKWDEYKRQSNPHPPNNLLPPKRDLKLETLAEVLRGERLVHAHCYRADEILMLIRLAEEFGFKIATFQHVLEGYKVANEIAAHGAGASAFSDWWAYKVEAYDAIPYNAAIMARKGVLVSFNSDSAELARRLNLEAAKAIKYGGFTEDEALALVTINPAKQLRIDKRVGSIEVGKDADLVIFSGHPLSTYSLVEKVFIDGQVYFDRQADLARRAEIEKEKKELKEKLKPERAGKKEAEKKETEEEPPPENEWENGRVGEWEQAGAGEWGNGRVRENPMDKGDAGEQAGAGEWGNGRVGDRSSIRPFAHSPIRPFAHLGLGQATQGSIYAIRNAKIVPITGPEIERGTVVIRNGRIAAVGANVSIPGNARVIDASGLAVYPGMIDSGTSIGLTEIGQVRATVDTRELGDFNPHMRAIIAIHPDSELIPVARVNGLTSVVSRPAGGVFSGQAALINLDGWTWEEMELKASVGVVFNYPSIQSGRFFDFATFQVQERSYQKAKQERDEKLDKIRRLLDDARAYAKAKEAKAKDPSLPDLEVDHVLEALIPVVKGEWPFIVSADKEQDIKDAIEFAEQQKVKMILSGGADAWKVTALLKEKAIPVLLGPILTLPEREDDSYDQPFITAKALREAGVKFAFQTDDASNVRNLPYHAAMCVAFGLPREEALKALTISPAEIWGVADQVGSIEVGKLANLVVWDGDPLEIRSQVKYLFIKGNQIPLTTKHTELYERYRNRP